MRPTQLMTGFLLLTGSLALSPAFAQESTDKTEIKDFAQEVVQEPQDLASSFELQELQIPPAEAIRITPQYADIIANTKRMTMQYVTGMEGSSFGGDSPMSKKTRRVVALRKMLALKLAQRDLEKALPILKQMDESNLKAPVNPEKALDEEYQALLKANPGDKLPPSSSGSMLGAAAESVSDHKKLVSELEKEIGKQKSEGLLALINNQSSINFTTTFNNGVNVYQYNDNWNGSKLNYTQVLPKTTYSIKSRILKSDGAKASTKDNKPTSEIDELTITTEDGKEGEKEERVIITAPENGDSTDGAQKRVKVLNGSTLKSYPEKRTFVTQTMKTDGKNRTGIQMRNAFQSSSLSRISLKEMISLIEAKLEAMKK